MKKIVAVIASFLLSLTLVVPVFAKGDTCIKDNTNALTSEEVEALNEKANQIYDKTGIHVGFQVVQDTDGKGLDEVSDQMYLDMFDREPGVLMIFSEEDNEWTIMCNGSITDVMSQDDADDLYSIYETDRTYYEATDEYFNQLEAFIEDHSEDLGSPQNLVVDQAKQLEPSQKEEISQRVKKIQKEHDFDVVFVIVPTLDGKEPRDYADDYFDYNGYGQGEGKDGLLFLHCPEERKWWISTHGAGEEYFTDDGLEYIKSQVVPLLKDEDYEAVYDKVLDLSEDFIVQAETGEPYTKRTLPKHLDLTTTLIEIVVCFLIAGFACAYEQSKLHTIRNQDTANAYVRPGSLKLTVNRDRFTHQTLTSRTIEKDEGSHTSSSGESHGGTGGSY